jgi:hypothetical protein
MISLITTWDELAGKNVRLLTFSDNNMQYLVAFEESTDTTYVLDEKEIEDD